MFHAHKQRMLSGAIELKDGEEDANEFVTKALADLQKTVDDRLKAMETKGIDPKLLERLGAVELKLNRPGLDGNEKPRKAQRKLEKKAFDVFIRKGFDALSADERKQLIVGSDPAGGYIAVPQQFVQELDRNLVLTSPIRGLARIMPTGSGSVRWPKRTNGMATGSWVGEVDDRPETTVTFGESTYDVKEFADYVDVSNAMVEDSAFPIDELLAYEFGESMGVAEGTAFVNGDGVLRPFGFMQDTTVPYVPTGFSGGFLTTGTPPAGADCLIDAYHSVKPLYRAQGVWGMNSKTLGITRKLKDGQGRYIVNIAGMDNTPVTTLLGRPIVEMPDMPDFGAGTFPIVFGDFNQYRIFDRVKLQILRDPFTQQTKGKIRFHGRRRVAGGMGKSEAFVKIKAAVS